MRNNMTVTNPDISCPFILQMLHTYISWSYQLPSIGNGDMTCKLCDMGAKEDIIHFLFVCPYLMHTRNIFTSKMSSWINNFDNLSNTEKIHIILNFDASQTKAHIYKLDSQIIGCIISFIIRTKY